MPASRTSCTCSRTVRTASASPKDPVRQKAALDFFRWSLGQGGEQARALHFVPLPPELVQQVETYWSIEFK